jgi:RNA polymerase sigma-70 factor (ECF subfamily)
MNPPPLDSATLDAIRRGDPDARLALLEAWTPLVLRWSAHLGGLRIDAEDVAHDVLVRVLVGIGGLRDPKAFPAWLFRATKREVSRHQNRAFFRRWIPGLLLDEIPAPPASDVASQVQAVLDELPADSREILVLCDLEERTDEEVATLLGLPVGTVKSRLRTARARFEKRARRHDLAPDAEPA